jgi:cytochrome c oxidase subunit II
MTSDDLIHSFYIPNFRMKRDVLPNRYTTLWFQAEKVGTFQLFCTEFCGDGHSMMLGSVRVLSQEDYDAWVANGGSEGGDQPLDQVGAKLYTSRGCNACHTLDGANGIGPTWKGLFGSKRAFVSGGSKVADEDYLRESIVNPAANIVQGYQPVMPAMGDLLSDREVSALIEYIKTLK